MKNQTGKTLKRMLACVWQRDPGMYGMCALYMVLSAIPLCLTVLLPKLVIGQITSAAPRISAILLIAAGYLVLAGACTFFSEYIVYSTYTRLMMIRIDNIRESAMKLLTMDFRYTEDATFFDKNELAFEATSNNDNGIEGVYHRLFGLPARVLGVIALTVLIGLRSPAIAAAIFVHVTVSAVVARRVQKFQYSKREEIGHAERRMGYYNQTTQDYAYGKELRLFSLRERVLANYKKEIDGYISVQRLIAKKEYALGFLALIALLAADTATYGILVHQAMNGMSIADFSMYLTAALTLTAWLTIVSERVTFVLNEMLYCTDYFRFIDADYGEKGGTHPAADAGDTLKIEFRHVSFRYPNTEQNVINDLNLTIPKGQRLAIVGVNGAGKTTLVKLLTGLYAVDEGEILINGVNVNDYDKQALYGMFSVVFQDVNVLAFTVAENVAARSEGIDRDRVHTVLQRVGLSDKVASLPKGIDTVMLKIIDENGAEFSGGESQKLMIARALYKNGSMVIMDEPTAALDALAEAEIYREFADLVGGKTAVYISHRLASTRFCDQIALFDKDGLIEYGTHDELMEKGGKYAEMFTIQGKYYTEGGENE